MRPPSLANLVRTFYTISNATSSTLFRHQRLGLVPFRPQISAVQNSLMPNFLTNLFTTSAPSNNMSYPFQPGNEYWKNKLTAEQRHVLLDKGTEPAGTGALDQHYPSKDDTTTYNCAGCDQPLYTAVHKFKSGCGWPAFFDAIPGAVDRHTDSSWGMARTEILCSKCGGHLGHVFKGEGYATPTDERHCVNSMSINFGDGMRGDGVRGAVKKVDHPDIPSSKA